MKRPGQLPGIPGPVQRARKNHPRGIITSTFSSSPPDLEYRRPVENNLVDYAEIIKSQQKVKRKAGDYSQRGARLAQLEIVW